MPDAQTPLVARDETVNIVIRGYLSKFVSTTEPDNKHEEEIARALSVLLTKYVSRAEFGFNKYKTTTFDRTDIDQKGWFTHLQEELMDSTVYNRRIVRDLPPGELRDVMEEQFYDLMRHTLFVTHQIILLSK